MAQVVSNASTVPSRKILIDEADPNNVYIGYSKVGGLKASAIWQIRKVQKTAGVTEILYANGVRRFNQIWNDRASLIYS